MAAQLRLWHALERRLLCPFQYFGIADGTDLSGLKWRRGAYETLPLERLYTGGQARTLRVLQAVERNSRSCTNWSSTHSWPGKYPPQ